MLIELWLRTSGTWINVATVLVGAGLGLLLRDRISKSMLLAITQGVGLLTLFLGITMAGRLLDVKAGAVDGIIIGLLAMVFGGIVGEWAQIEQKLGQVGDWLKRQVRGSGQFTEGFVAASLLFCIGPMTLVGSINNGLLKDNALLTLKATMDGFAAIALTSSFGAGVAFSSLSVLVYQGALSLGAGLFAQVLPNPDTNPLVLLMTGVGGLMILGIGLNLLEIAKIRVASFLPGLMLAPLLYGVFVQLF
ncbi:MAG: DUF554 domain-containing protein [Thainema sp.]